MGTKDPLLDMAAEGQIRLMQKFGKLASGSSQEVVMGAALNIITNALRQTYPNRLQAVSRYEELIARGREILAEQYNAAGKRKEGVPFTQHIHVPLLKDIDKF